MSDVLVGFGIFFGVLLLPVLFYFVGWWTVTVADFLDRRFGR